MQYNEAYCTLILGLNKSFIIIVINCSIEESFLIFEAISATVI